MADILVNNLGLSVRASNALRRMHIDTLEQLLNTSMEEIIKKGKKFGEKTIEEIDAFRKDYLKGDIDPNLWKRIIEHSEEALMCVKSEILSKLFLCSERELRDIKETWTKSCDEVFKAIDAQLERNLCNVDSGKSEEILFESEKTFLGKQKDSNNSLDRPNIMQYLDMHERDFVQWNYELLIRWLKGESFQELGERFGLSDTRARQIVHKMVEKISNVYEDYYSSVYEYFNFTKSVFCNVFPECGEESYKYLSLKYTKGDHLICGQSVEDYNGIFKERLKQYWKEVGLNQYWKEEEKKQVAKMVDRVLMRKSNREMPLEDSKKDYSEYLEHRNYSSDEKYSVDEIDVDALLKEEFF